MYSSRTYDVIKVACRAGIIAFVVLYIVASRYYPGGSDFNPSAIGFDWIHNYWCELLAPDTASGVANAASPIAIGAFIMLDLVLVLCWIQSSFLFPGSPIMRWLTIVSGLLSGVALAFLSSGSHDLIINIAGGFGLLALLCTLAGLARQQLAAMLLVGLCCVLLFVLNLYIYYSGTWFGALPVIQKISFALFLYWFWRLAGIMEPLRGADPTP